MSQFRLSKVFDISLRNSQIEYLVNRISQQILLVVKGATSRTKMLAKVTVFILACVQAQGWAVRIDGSGSDDVISVATDSQNNVYALG